jgi:hypothetical protein
MTEPKRPSTAGTRPDSFRSPISLRTGAILLMVVGAAGFVAARLMFGEQVLCLLGSTLVVFFGLGLIIMARRNNAAAGNQAPAGVEYAQPLPQTANRRSMPPGLRAAARQQAAKPVETPRPVPPSQTVPPPPPQVEPEPAELTPEPYFIEPPAPDLATDVPLAGEPLAGEPHAQPDESLMDAVITVFESQGARVNIETRREDRGILSIQAADGLMYTALVLEQPDTMTVADVRALNALMGSSGSVGGYLISAGAFSQQAYDWAGQRRIRLVAADEIDELGI